MFRLVDRSEGRRLLGGAWLALPVALSVAAYGLIWGVLAGQTGLSLAEVAALSAFVFAGACQFVALDLWTPTPQFWPLLAATLAVNLRFLLMTATLRPTLAGRSRGGTWARLFLVADENWALGMAETARRRDGYAALIGGGLLIYAVWLGGTVAGRVVGVAVDDPSRWGLDFAFTAVFLALLVGLWRDTSDLLPWLVAAGTAVLAALLLPGKWYMIVGGLAGSLVGGLASMGHHER